MGAPLKRVLDKEIKINPDLLSDPNFLILEDEYPKALKFYVLIWQKIYANFYFAIWDDETRNDLSEKLKMSLKDIDELMLRYCKYRFFDAYQFSQNGVITNEEVQKLWVAKSRRRTLVKIYTKYLILEESFVFRYIINSPEIIRSKVENKPAAPVEKIHKEYDLKPPVPKSASPERIEELRGKLPDKDNPTHTKEELLEFIEKPYQDYPLEFRNIHTPKWFESYVWFSRLIITKYRTILNSRYQMTIEQYREFRARYPSMTKEEIEEVLVAMAGTGNKDEASIYHRYLKFIPKPTVNRGKPRTDPTQKILSDSTQKVS